MGCASTNPAPPVCQSEEVAIQDFHEKYLLGIKLGRGAFAQVRIVTKVYPGPLHRPGSENALQQERAVKILDLRDKDKPDEASPSLQKAAHKEATVWKALGNHPNCIRLYDLFFSNEFCFMVMEKCMMGLLQALESMPELTERGLGNVFAQMLLGIAHCHSVKVVHRDIKPDNFLVGGEDGQVVKLGDFGLSAIMPKQGKLPGVFGTAPFMCPEMLVGRWYDEKSDVWSLAVIVYAFLFGLFPYMPRQQSSKAMKQAIIDGSPVPSFEPVQRAGTGSRSLFRSEPAMQFVSQLLNRDPEARPSAEEALNFPWMASAMCGSHLPGVELPSLRPMLHAAKKVGAFEVRDPAQHCPLDDYLNHIQLQRHGRPLPVTPSGSSLSSSNDRARERAKAKERLVKKESWENSSNRSTACDSDGVDRNSRLNDGSSDRGQSQHGSGCSKGQSSSGINSEAGGAFRQGNSL